MKWMVSVSLYLKRISSVQLQHILTHGLSTSFIPPKAVIPLPCVLQPLVVSFPNLFSGSILEKDKFFLQGKSKAWPRGWFACDREPKCEPCQDWLLLPRAPNPVAARCVSSDACTSCPTENYRVSISRLQEQLCCGLCYFWHLELRNHTHIKQTKNMSGPKKHSVSQRQRGVAPA